MLVDVVVVDSSQMLFSISQKLIQHQILNYTEILKWLREILICHIQFLQKHRDYANVGSNIPICRQAHIKLEVTLSAWVCCSVGRFTQTSTFMNIVSDPDL